ncbi:NAD kinase [Bacteroidia bacterium]|nr:NAD kinase [Bacteroidia bacterium]
MYKRKMEIGIFGSDYQTGKPEVIRDLFARLEEKRVKVWVEKSLYEYLTLNFGFTPAIAGLLDQNPHALDMVFSLGGDGTFLRTAAWVARQNIPILGINSGHLGFLADVDTLEIAETLDDIFQNKYHLEEKSLLELDLGLASSRTNIGRYALNEIAILKRDTAAMIAVSASIDGEFLTEYLGDGVLLSTPTGSTAYNLSVNGPILAPQTKNFVISPVASHSLNVRPLVIPETSKLRFQVASRNKNFLISLDGRSGVFPSGSELSVQKADFMIKVVKRENQTFYDTLRKKLLWGTDTRNVERN